MASTKVLLQQISVASTKVLLHLEKMEHEHNILKQKNSQLEWKLKYNARKAKSTSGSDKFKTSNPANPNPWSTSGMASDKKEGGDDKDEPMTSSKKRPLSVPSTASSDNLKTKNNGSTSGMSSVKKEGGDDKDEPMTSTETLEWDNFFADQELIECISSAERNVQPLTEAPEGGEGAGAYEEDKNKGNKVNNTKPKRKMHMDATTGKKRSKRDPGGRVV